MSVALSTRGLLLQNKVGKRIPEFVRALTDLLRDPRYIWLPLPSDYLTSIDKISEAVITHNTPQSGRLSRLGAGLQVTWDGSTNFGYTANNNARYSFNVGGLGLLDLPFSCLALANVTDTALFRPFLSKYTNGVTSEWAFVIGTGDQLRCDLFDQSAGVAPLRVSSTAITQGVPQLFGSSYDGTGGATAANGITLYAQGAVKASTATNQATYVAMENTVAPLVLGGRATANGSPPTVSNWMQGQMGFVALSGANLSANEHLEIYNLCKDFYGV